MVTMFPHNVILLYRETQRVTADAASACRRAKTQAGLVSFCRFAVDAKLPSFSQEPKEADFASKEDLERWGGGGGAGGDGGAPGQAARGASDAAERAREAVAKASKVGEGICG